MNINTMMKSKKDKMAEAVFKAMDNNPEGQLALKYIMDGMPVTFVTGKAGTGKSYWIQQAMKLTDKETVLLAPTGISALNILGQTIHSFFRFGIGMHDTDAITKKDCPNLPLFKSLERIILDEISMVRADLLDRMDMALRKWRDNDIAFGGVQIVLVGDCLQLPPVITRDEKAVFFNLYPSPWFFDAFCMHRIDISVVVLNKTFRQSDPVFIECLDRIRENNNHRDSVALLNRTCFRDIDQDFDAALMLCANNRQADQHNLRCLEAINSEEKVYEGKVKGGIKAHSKLPAPYLLKLKVGAQVMVVKNIGNAVNGTLGIVKKLEDSKITITTIDTHEEIVLERETWEKKVFKAENGAITSKVDGKFEQFALSLSWACTIHKSQGLTLESVEINLGSKAFVPGQGYVALSRCKSIQGIKLTKPLSMADVRADKSILDFYTLLNENLMQEKSA